MALPVMQNTVSCCAGGALFQAGSSKAIGGGSSELEFSSTTSGWLFPPMPNVADNGRGDLEGTQQSGNMFDLKIASIGKDNDILQLVRAVAEEILENDRFLEKPENVLLLQLLKMTKVQKTVDFSQIS